MTTGPDNPGSTSADGSGSAAPSPRLVFFGVTGRRDLAQRAAAAAPGVRFSARRHWTEDPGEPHRTLLGRRAASACGSGRRTAEEFAAQATAVLLRFVHPLLAREPAVLPRLPVRARALLAPRPLEAGGTRPRSTSRTSGACSA